MKSAIKSRETGKISRGFVCLLLFVTFGLLTSNYTLADNAPITTAGTVTNAITGVGNVSTYISVNNFVNVGLFTLTLKFDTTKIKFVSATANSSFPGMTITYTPSLVNAAGKLVLSWSSTSNVSLADNSHLADLTFTYLQGTAALYWSYFSGDVCIFKRYSGGSYTTLTDSPKSSFYLNAAISNRVAPVTYAPIILNPSVGPISIPITVTGFTNIGAITLSLEYDTLIIKYLNSFTPNAVVGSMLVGNQATTGSKKKIVMQWYGSAINLADASTLVTLNFTYSTINGVYTSLNWYESGPTCEYADASGNVLIDWPAASYYIYGQVGQVSVNTSLLDINLAKGVNCGEFTVKLVPLTSFQNNLTKITFTISWPAVTGSDVQLTNITATWPGLAQVGSRVLYNGNYYVTFTSTTSWAVNWAASTDNLIMSFRISGDGEGTANFTIIATDYSASPPGINTAYYAEVATVVKTNNILNNANSTSLNCRICLQDFLQGAYNTTTHLMRTDLKTAGLIPLSHPYSTSPWSYSGTESVASIPANVVDWVLVELRTGTAAATVVARRAGFIKNDGSIVDLDGLTGLVFYTFVPGSTYYVVVYHRNHFPVMTATAISLPNTVSTKHNFTVTPASNVYSTTNDGVIQLETGIYGQISGELYLDNKLKCSGSNNDRGLIIAKINAVYTPPPANLTSTISGYYAADLNMNGIVKYSGSQNDQGIIFSNIDALTTNTIWTSIYNGQVPIIYTAK